MQAQKKTRNPLRKINKSNRALWLWLLHPEPPLPSLEGRKAGLRKFMETEHEPCPLEEIKKLVRLPNSFTTSWTREDYVSHYNFYHPFDWKA